ncbi:hypothetical protein Q1695_012563 [Nippostrongylus brasiliensis]|nr:hypothetical protein Q1695_012563 [Nippostrongylus brasiliensis]
MLEVKEEPCSTNWNVCVTEMVRNSYPKKVTYVFFPLPRETAQKKSPTFSCLPESVRALSVDDILPPDSRNDLREAFNAAIKYLSMKGLPRGSAAPLRSPQGPSKGTTPADVRRESKKSTIAVAKETVEVPAEEKAEPKLVDDKSDLPADIYQWRKVSRITCHLQATVIQMTVWLPAGFMRKRNVKKLLSQDTSPSPDLLAPVLFREATQILEQVWATDLVQNYVTTHTGGLLTDHETDTLFEMIFNWVRDREKDSYFIFPVCIWFSKC